jgi:hypothetical protein
MTSSAARKIVERSSETLWFVARGNVLKGPFTSEQLQAKIRSRELSFFDFCWKQGFTEWRPITSVDSFDRRQRLSRIPSYPTLEIPGGAPKTLGLVSERAAPKNVKVTLSRSSRGGMTVIEWGIAVVFSVALAYFASSFALNEVQKGFEDQFAIHLMGAPKTYGQADSNTPPHFWDPVFSAPSFVELVQLNDGLKGSPLVKMPVSVTGHLSVDNGSPKIGSWTVLGAESLVDNLVAQESRLDPVYSNSVQIRGNLSLKNPQLIRLGHPGSPFVEFLK